ncbi:MAG: hypothetical protein ACKVZJ_14225 [Phycisphaerales bacterium]
MLGLILLLLIGALTAFALTTLMMMHRLTHPPGKTYAWAVSRGKPGTPMELPQPRAFEPRTLQLRAPAGRHTIECPAWYIPCDHPDGPLVIFTPGWGDSKLGVLPRLAPLVSRASAVLAWDPPGFGEAPGTCGLGVTEPALLAEIIEQQLTADPGFRRRGIVLFGSSLGAGVSIVAAGGGLDRADHPDRAPSRAAPSDGSARFAVTPSASASAALRRGGVIAEAPYREAPTPARNVMRLSGMPHRLNTPVAFALLAWMIRPRGGFGDLFAALIWGWRGYDRALHARRLNCPLMVLHPGQDEVSPVPDGEAIARAAGAFHAATTGVLPDHRASPGRLVIVPGAAHNSLWTDEATRPAAEAAVTAFLDEIAAANRAPTDVNK